MQEIFDEFDNYKAYTEKLKKLIEDDYWIDTCWYMNNGTGFIIAHKIKQSYTQELFDHLNKD